MSRHTTKHPLVRWLLRPMPVIVTAAVVCFGGWYVLGSGGLWDMYSLRQRSQRQQQQIADLKLRRDYVQQRLADLKAKDPLALEQAARDFGLVAPGETIYEIKIDSVKR